MKHIFFILLSLIFCCCDFKGDQKKNRLEFQERCAVELQATYTIIEIDGCEYIFCNRYGAQAFTHKGNCKNHNSK